MNALIVNGFVVCLNEKEKQKTLFDFGFKW